MTPAIAVPPRRERLILRDVQLPPQWGRGNAVTANDWRRFKIGTPSCEVRACFCVGPQNGDPVCPCRMRAVRVVDGRYVEIIDHGPAEPSPAIRQALEA